MTPLFREIRSVVDAKIMRTTMKQATQVETRAQMVLVMRLALDVKLTIKEQLQ